MPTWRSELKRLSIVLAISGLIGFLLGELLLLWLLVLLGYAVFNILQLRRLNNWLGQNPLTRSTEPPESIGLWGEILDGIYRLQREERTASNYLKNIIDKAQESTAALEMAIVMINNHNSLDWWNEAAEHLLGFQATQDRNQPVTNLIRNPAFLEYFQNENYDETLVIESPTDNNKILEFQITVFGEHERLMIVRDITQLQRLESMRKDFVGNVSHELGTPITVIKGYLEAILDNMDGLEPKWRKPIEQMRQQSLRMENIVRDLLMLSSLETKTAAKLHKEVNLRELINEIESDTQQMFKDKSHEFINQCEDNIYIKGKRRELYSAISNLVVNAAKYTPAEGTIELSANYTDDGFELVVQDNGIGIEKQHIPRLTERFYRVDVSRSSETGGTGLGLAIVKHILIRHDADLEIESEYGKGSRFICKFPLERISIASEFSEADESEQDDPVLDTTS